MTCELLHRLDTMKSQCAKLFDVDSPQGIRVAFKESSGEKVFDESSVIAVSFISNSLCVCVTMQCTCTYCTDWLLNTRLQFKCIIYFIGSLQICVHSRSATSIFI